MKALRVTHWAPDLDPVTIIAREDALKVSIEAMAETQRIAGVFTIIDFFEVEDDGDAEGAAAIGAKRAAERFKVERNMAMLFYFDAETLARVNPGGVLTATLPAPLSKDDIVATLLQLAAHPNYHRSQSVLAISEDHEIVMLRGGEIIDE